jgi:hypothetical protein
VQACQASPRSLAAGRFLEVSASIARFVLSVVLLATCGVATACGGEVTRSPMAATTDSTVSAAVGPESSTAGGPFRFFSPSGVWNEPVPSDAPLAASSTAIVDALAQRVVEEEQLEIGPFINTTVGSVPIYTVPADQPTVRVTLTGSASREPALQAAWDAVPLPADAEPAAGSDKHLVVWQPSTDRLWEFWRLVHEANGWLATWGGAMRDVSSNPGVYGSQAWPGAQAGWGSSATALSIAGGLITLEDLKLGEINHALAMAVPDTRAGVYASPAVRTDGKTGGPWSIPEGAHFRLDPSLDLAALHLPRFTLMLAEAAQRYGIFVRDTSRNVTFYGQDPTPTEANPYAGPGGYFEGRSPMKLLASFPWSHLQLLKLELHRSRPRHTTRRRRRHRR